MEQPKITIKASLEGLEDIRRFSLYSCSFPQVYETIKKLFSLEQPFVITYKDSDGDFLTISNEIELEEAVQVNSPLRLFIKLGKADVVIEQAQKIEEPDNSVFGARLKWRKRMEERGQFGGGKCGGKFGKMQGLIWRDPELRETREQIIAAKAELLAAQEKVVQLKKKFHEQFRAAREKRMNEMKEVKEAKPEMKNLKIIARFVKHITVPDDSNLPPNTEFVKTWRFRNDSNRAWPEAKLIFVGKTQEDRLASESSFDVGSLAPGQYKDISIKMKSPALTGRYVSNWRLFDPESKLKFGQKIWAQINVVEHYSDDEALLSFLNTNKTFPHKPKC